MDSSLNRKIPDRLLFDQMLPTLKLPLPSIITLQPPANEAETFLLRSIEWTTFLESYLGVLEVGVSYVL